MKKIILLLSIGLAVSVFLVNCQNQQIGEALAQESCNCEDSWFPHQQTPNPLDDSTSNFYKLKDSTNNCMFHQFSVQKFLWITRTMKTGNPYFLDSLIQVNIKLEPIKPKNGVALVLDDTLQAGSNGTLKSNPAYAIDGKTSYMVYYSKFVNDKLFTTCKKYADLLSGPDSIAVRTKNDYQFPDGSLETKASWINVNAIEKEEQKKYFTTEAVVMVNGKYENQIVALLGIHVTTKVINHPEFIWATFQHHGMAPYHNWATKNTETKSDNNYLFFAKGTTKDVEGISWYNKITGVDSIRPVPNQSFSVYKYGTPVTIGNSYVDTSSQGVKGDKMNFNNVESINASYKNYFAKQNDVWQNYLYNGAIWLNTDGLSAAQQTNLIYNLNGVIEINKGAPSRGSLAAMNITMETYRQVFESLNAVQVSFNDIGNCFGCHTGQTVITDSVHGSISGTSPLYFSHIFNHYLRSYKKPNRLIENDAKKHDNYNDAKAAIRKSKY